MKVLSPAENLALQNENEKSRTIEINYPDSIESTRELIKDVLSIYTDSKDLEKVEMDRGIARIVFFTHSQARQAEWRMMQSNDKTIKPKFMGTKLRLYPVLLSLCVEGNPPEEGKWELEPTQKVVERWCSPAWVRQQTDGQGSEMLEIQIIEAKKGSDNYWEQKYDTDYTLLLPYRGIHGASITEPVNSGESFCVSVKLRLEHPPDVFRWDTGESVLLKQLNVMETWKMRCSRCGELNKDDHCESCGATELETESPGVALMDCLNGALCKDATCNKHLKRDLFSGNNTTYWVNPTTRPSFQTAADSRGLAEWKIHCRTFDEPDTHLLQHIGECWVWVLTFYTDDQSALEDFKSEIQGSVPEKKRDEIYGNSRILPLNTSNLKNQRNHRGTYKIQLGIRLWNSEAHWPNSKQNLEEYLLQGQESILGRHDGITRINQVYGLQSVLACFPAPIIREELLPFWRKLDPLPGISGRNKFLTYFQSTFLTPEKELSDVKWKVDYQMLALSKMRDKLSDKQRKYDFWYTRHFDEEKEKDKDVVDPGPSYYINETLGRHPEAFLNRADDSYTKLNFDNDMSKSYRMENVEENKIWVKDIYLTPTRIDYRLKIDENNRIFRDGIVDKRFCARVHFQEDWAAGKSHRKPWFWKPGVGFNVAAKVLMNNISAGVPMIGGFIWRHIVYSDKQVKDSAFWAFCEWDEKTLKGKYQRVAYKPEGNADTAQKVINSLSNWNSISNIGKKMARAALYFSGGCGVSTVDSDHVERVQDRTALDGKMLTDGCGLIRDTFVKEYIQRKQKWRGARLKNVAMIQGKYKGCKGMWAVVPEKVLVDVIKADDDKIRSQGKEPPLRIEPKNVYIILPDSMWKFNVKDDVRAEIEIKSTIGAMAAKLSREVIGVMEAHGTEVETLIKYQTQYMTLLKGVLDGHVGAAITWLEECRVYGALNDLRNMDKRRNDKHNWRNRDEREWEDFWQKLKYGTEDNAKSAAMGYAKMKRGFKILLRYPSVRMKAICDWTGSLGPGEIFIKTQVLEYVNRKSGYDSFDWTCPKCEKKNTKESDMCCGRPRRCKPQDYMVFEGDVGLLKNPCLHATSWIRAQAVYKKNLDEIFPDAEVFLFCGRQDAEFCLVNKLSGGDLDGDDFLIITQKDLLPEENFSRCPELIYDEIPPKKRSAFITNEDCVNFFINFQNDDMVSTISQYHEAWSNRPGGIINKECIELAKLHSIAIDYAKNNNKVDLDESHSHLKKIKFPSYLGYPSAMSQHYKDSLKGKLSDALTPPKILRLECGYRWFSNNFEFVNGGNQRMEKKLRRRPRRFGGPYCKDCGDCFKSMRDLEQHRKTAEHLIRRQENLVKKFGIKEDNHNKNREAGKVNRNEVMLSIDPRHREPRAKLHVRPVVDNPHVREAAREARCDPAKSQKQRDDLTMFKEDEEWIAENQFQYLIHVEPAGPMWKCVDDLHVLLELNGLWRQWELGYSKQSVFEDKRSKYTYDIDKRTRKGASGTVRPLRWGRIEVLNASNTAHLVKDIEVDTLKKWAGFIAERQIGTQSTNLEEKHEPPPPPPKSNEIVHKRDNKPAIESQHPVQWHGPQAHSQPLVHPNGQYRQPPIYPEKVYVNPNFNRFQPHGPVLSNRAAQFDNRQKQPNQSFEPVRAGWQSWNGASYSRHEHKHHDAHILNENMGFSRFNQARAEPLNVNHSYRIQSGYENPRIHFQSQSHEINNQHNIPAITQNQMKYPKYSKYSKRPASLREVSDGSNSEASSSTPIVSKIHEFKEDSKLFLAPKSAHKRVEATFYRGHPYLSTDAACVQRRGKEESPMLQSSRPPYAPSSRKEYLENVTAQENLDTLNLSDKHYNNELKSSPDNVPLSNSVNPHFDLGPSGRRPIQQQFQHENYYRQRQPPSQYSSRPSYSRARSLHLNTNVQQMPPRKPRIDRWGSLPPRSYYPSQPSSRSGAKSIGLLQSRALSPRPPNDRRFEDSECGKYESESTSQSSRTSLLPSYPLVDIPKRG